MTGVTLCKNWLEDNGLKVSEQPTFCWNVSTAKSSLNDDGHVTDCPAFARGFSFVRRPFRQSAVVPPPKWQNGYAGPIAELLHDDETAVVRFTIDKAKTPVGLNLPERHTSTCAHHFSNRRCRESRPFTLSFLRVKRNPRPSIAGPSLREMHLLPPGIAGCSAIQSVSGHIAKWHGDSIAQASGRISSPPSVGLNSTVARRLV
jgi:hypothetical protein